MRHVDDTMMELEHRWIEKSGVDLDLNQSEATFLLVVDAGDESRAISQARGVVSMAIHAAGGPPPPRPFPRDADWSVRLLATWATPRAEEGGAAASRLHEGDLHGSSAVRYLGVGERHGPRAHQAKG